MQVVAEMKQAGVLVFAGGLDEEIENTVGSNSEGTLSGPITKNGEFLGGMPIADVATDAEANEWGRKNDYACT